MFDVRVEIWQQRHHQAQERTVADEGELVDLLTEIGDMESASLIVDGDRVELMISVSAGRLVIGLFDSSGEILEFLNHGGTPGRRQLPRNG